MRETSKNAYTVQFTSQNLGPATQPSPNIFGWSLDDFRSFFEQQLSCVAEQVRKMQDELILQKAYKREMTDQASNPFDPVHQAGLIRRLLESSRHLADLAESLQQEPQLSDFDIVRLVKSAKENCAGGLTLEIDCDSCLVRADETQVYLAIAMLLMDRAGHSAPVCISIFNDGNHWELEIADCWEDFSADSLGFKTAQCVARNHGGKIQVHPCPQGGTAFNLTFPQQAMKRAA